MEKLLSRWPTGLCAAKSDYNGGIVSELGKLLLAAGALLAIIGLILMFAGRFHVPLGRLPGDFSFRGRNTVVYFPLGTCILLSLLLTLLLWLISYWRR
jgi:hypothetical protein